MFSAGHLFGTDPVGNDILSRLLHGGQASLEIAFAVNLIGLVVGGQLGALAAYWGGAVDPIIMRVLDVLIAFPSLVLALAIAQSLGPSKTNTIFALAFFSVAAFARISRAATLQLREQTFMTAARLSGTPAWRTLMRHIAPNILPGLITFALLGMGIIIILEGALSFLGLGVPPPAPSWGNMISNGQQTLSATPRVRAPAERVPVRDRPGVQPPRRRAALALERPMTPLLQVSDLRVRFEARRGASACRRSRG